MHPTIVFEHIAGDCFAGTPAFFVGELCFERDEHERVTGFRLSGERYREVLFERVGA